MKMTLHVSEKQCHAQVLVTGICNLRETVQKLRMIIVMFRPFHASDDRMGAHRPPDSSTFSALSLYQLHQESA